MYINIVYLNMNYGIHEQVTKNHDDGYTILLNARDSHAMNEYSLQHALKHIRRGDFDKSNVQSIEYDTHIS